MRASLLILAWAIAMRVVRTLPGGRRCHAVDPAVADQRMGRCVLDSRHNDDETKHMRPSASLGIEVWWF